MSGNVVQMRRKLKGGTVALFMRPGHDLVVHIDDKGGETELEMVDGYATAEAVGRRYATKFGARYVGLMFG